MRKTCLTPERSRTTVRESLRLYRYLATSGVASRRRCDDLIRAGRIAVNGVPVAELGTRVNPAHDEVTVDGKLVSLPDQRWTLAMNKPRDVLVAASDSRGRRTVLDLLEGFPGRVFPVGRLDYRSEGLLLFTNDGDLAYRLAHPRFKVEKLYRVDVVGQISPSLVDSFRKGVMLEDGRTQPAVLAVVQKTKTRSSLEIELREGRKRQIRRMLAIFGHEVTRLRRIRFGPIALGDLPEGAWRELSSEEVRGLRRAVDLPVSRNGDEAA
ncbi:MAG: rRNA pseudouridine synthase [Gemmatimonadetes bacterium]|nr:rRNA pseudouridine synthase [Gemmatimonadota bacterium]